jgi:phenylacetate-CoA ligase
MIELLKYYRKIGKIQKMRGDNLEKWHFNKMKTMVTYTYENVEYYHKLYEDAGFHPSVLKKPEDLEKIPVADKDDYRCVPLEKRVSSAKKARKIIRLSTSGSSGKPLTLLSDTAELAKQRVKWFYAMGKYGYSPFDLIVHIFRSGTSQSEPIWSKFGIFRREIISVLEPPQKIFKKVREFNPDILVANRSFFLMMIDEFLKQGVNIRPKFIINIGEVLYPKDYEKIVSYFGVPILNIYSSVECGNIAYTCPEGNRLHLHHESIFINYFRDTEKVIITNYENYVCPFVNYDLGDIAKISFGDCCCGLSSPYISKISGKDNDFIYLKDGTRIWYQFFNVVVKSFDEVNQFKIVQHRDGSIDVLVKLFECAKPSADREALANGIKQKLAINLKHEQVSVRFVDEIPLGPSGKLQSVESSFRPKRGDEIEA